MSLPLGSLEVVVSTSGSILHGFAAWRQYPPMFPSIRQLETAACREAITQLSPRDATQSTCRGDA